MYSTFKSMKDESMINRAYLTFTLSLPGGFQRNSSYVCVFPFMHFAHGGGFVAWFFFTLLDLSLGGLNENFSASARLVA